MTNSQRLSRKLAVLSVSFALAAAVGTGRADTTSTWTNTAGGNNWGNAGNWSPNSFYPNNGSGGVNYNVVIGTPSPTYLDVNVTIDSLTLNAGGSLLTNGGTTLSLNGPTLVDNGSITINQNLANAQTGLSFLANTTLSGTGTLTLNDNGNLNAARIDTAANVTLTQASGHTIAGHGELNAAFINNGTINANSNAGSAELVLETNAMTNNSIFEATGNGTLVISGITVTQSATAQILGSSAIAVISSSTINNGIVNSSGNGSVQIQSAATFSNVTNSGVLNIVGAATLTANGNLVDNGIITVNSNTANAQTGITFGGGNLTGTGTIVLNDNGNDNAARLDGTFTQAAGHSIVGHGEINAAFTNNGVVNANSTAGSAAIVLQSNPVTNNNLLEGTAGGTLVISGITVTQGANGTITASNGTVDINSSSILGGTITTASGGSVNIGGGSGTFSNVTNNGILNIGGGTTLTANGTLTNNSTLTVNTNEANAQTGITFNTATLTGSGTIVLNDNGNSNNARIDGTFTQSGTHTITGHGIIYANFTNAGIVNANVSGDVLYVDSATVANTNLIEATNGATLVFTNGVVVTNTGGTIQAATGNVTISNASFLGGTFTSNGTNSFSVYTASFTTPTFTTGIQFNVITGYTVTFTGPTLVNNGAITINLGEGNSQTGLTFASNTSISGTGSIYLNDNTNNNNARIDAAANVTVTLGANTTLYGHGAVTAPLINNGIINANSTISGAVLLLQDTITNNKTIEATGGGTLNLNSATITQVSPGQITANASTVNVINSSLVNGTLSSSGGGSFQIIGTSTFTSLTSNAFVGIQTGQTLNIAGNLVDNGNITIDTGGNSQTILSFNGGTVSGTGTLFLNDNGGPNNARLDGTLTQAAGHTIAGHGNINAVVTNSGTINANTAGDNLNFDAATLTNNSLIEATLGTISFTSIAVTQGSGAQITAANGTVTVNSSSISGGTLNMTTGGSFQIVGTSSFTSLTSNAFVGVQNGQTLNILGNLVDNSNITVNNNGGNSQTILSFNGGTVSGTGTLFLNDNGNPNNARLDGTLTQAAGHTIAGHGNINAVVTNSGTINANTAGYNLNFDAATLTNNSFIEATLGTISFTSIAVTQGSGAQITAANGTVTVSSSSISGGTLNMTTGGSFQITGSSSFTSLTSNAFVGVQNAQTLNLFGTIVDNGNITINNNGGNSQTSLSGSNATVSGTGTIFLNDNGNANNARLDGTLTQAAGHTITGHGNINAALTNNGTVVASASNTLNLLGTITNTALIRATTGGAINFGSGAVLANGSLGTGTFQTDANSTMSFPSNFALNNGIISLTAPTSSVTGLTSITNAGNIALVANATLTLSGSLTGTSTGALTGNGTVIASSYFGSLAITGGTARAAINGATTGTSKLTKLALAGSTNAWTSDFDLTNNKLVVEDSTTHAATLATLQNQAFYGRTHATGITSSDLPAGTVIAVADNAAFATPFATFGGQMVDSNSILVAPELLGDTDFSGKVDLTDLNNVLNHLGVTTSAWTSGNFDGAATIDLTDLNDVLNNLGQTYSNPNVVLTPTPEPASLALLVISPVVLMRRRNRNG